MSPEPSGEALTDLAAELAAAEEAEAQALADAARAEARAAELSATVIPQSPAVSRWARLGPRILVAAVGLTAGAAVAVTGLMVWQHSRMTAQRAHETTLVDAARAAVVALLSIDHATARADVARVLDLSTGSFRDDFAKSADDFVATAEKSKAVTKGTVNAAALDSDGGDTGVVLIAATSQVSNAGGAREDPRPFRMSVTVTRDGGQFKMSDLEFVP